MERFDTDVSTTETTFQQAPEVLDTVGVNAPVYIGFSVINDLVNVAAVRSELPEIRSVRGWNL